MSVGLAVVIVTVIGLLGASVLVVASQFLKVEEDPRIGEVKEALPGVNCGACGYAGCADYAEAVVAGEEPSLCIPGGAVTSARVAGIMGADAASVCVRKAVVKCQGDCEHVSEKYEYSGIETCAAAANLHGGVSSCVYGCIGYGDCKDACRFDAIQVKDGLARVVVENCTGCGACVKACPKNIILLRGESAQPTVKCENKQKGAVVRKECSVGCIACMKCQKTCAFDAIHVVDGVAVIDYDKCTACNSCVAVCPVKCIALASVV